MWILKTKCLVLISISFPGTDSQKDHYDEPAELKLNNKALLAYSNSQHSSASSSGSSAGHPSQHTGYSSVQSGSTAAAFNPASALGNSNLSNTFQHAVLTHDSMYPQSSGSLANSLANNLPGQFNLNGSHNSTGVGIYSTTSRLTPSLRTLAYGNNLNTKYWTFSSPSSWINIIVITVKNIESDIEIVTQSSCALWTDSVRQRSLARWSLLWSPTISNWLQIGTYLAYRQYVVRRCQAFPLKKSYPIFSRRIKDACNLNKNWSAWHSSREGTTFLSVENSDSLSALFDKQPTNI